MKYKRRSRNAETALCARKARANSICLMELAELCEYSYVYDSAKLAYIVEKACTFSGHVLIVRNVIAITIECHFYATADQRLKVPLF